nr:TPA_asm: cupiennin [Parasteatoda house spider adintovirus]
MYQNYHCCTKSFEDYYSNQAGNGLSYYKGVSLQRGSGLGGIFKSMFRMVLPLFKSGAKAVGKQALKSGVDIANDYMQGKDIRDASKQRIKEATKILTNKAADKVKTMVGGHKRKRKNRKSTSSKKYRKVCTPDIFS